MKLLGLPADVSSVCVGPFALFYWYLPSKDGSTKQRSHVVNMVGGPYLSISHVHICFLLNNKGGGGWQHLPLQNLQVPTSPTETSRNKEETAKELTGIASGEKSKCMTRRHAPPTRSGSPPRNKANAGYDHIT